MLETAIGYIADVCAASKSRDLLMCPIKWQMKKVCKLLFCHSSCRDYHPTNNGLVGGGVEIPQAAHNKQGLPPTVVNLH